MKKLFNILIYLSFLFLIIYLYKLDYFRFRQITFNPSYLIISIILLFTGFIFQSICWWKALRVHSLNRSREEAIISHGQSIFGKYIPGKIWVILGRAGYVARQKSEFKTTSFISLKEQLIYIWVGLVVSAIPTFIYYGFRWISILVVIICIILTVVLFSQWLNHFFFSLFEKIFRRKFDFPLIDLRNSLSIVIYELFFWFLISAAFVLFIRALSADASYIMAFAYPLSVSLSILAIILPAGLGIREGILTGFLILSGMEIETATTISILSRFWYMLGEAFLFLTATTIRIAEKKRS